jgi:hypothetical protein
MDERDQRVTGTASGDVVDRRDALVSQAGQGGRHVLDAVRDVMHPGSALGEEDPNGCIRPERPEQLDERGPYGEQDLFDALLLHAFPMGRFDPERSPVALDRGLQVVHRDPDVVEIEDHRFLRTPGCIRATRSWAAAT